MDCRLSSHHVVIVVVAVVEGIKVIPDRWDV